MKKRIVSLLLALSLCVMVFSGCSAGGRSGNPPSNTSASSEEANTTESSEEITTTESSEETTEEITVNANTGSGITAQDVYSRAVTELAAIGIDDVSALETDEDGENSFTFLEGGITVKIYNDANGNVTSVISICTNTNIMEAALTFDEEGLVAFLLILAAPMFALDDNADMGSLLMQLLQAERIEEDGAIYRTFDKGNWRYGFMTEQGAIALGASYLD